MRNHYDTYPSHPLGVLSNQMGNLIFHVGYQTMDTFEHEACIFQEALRYFVEAYKKYDKSGRIVYNLEDQILVLYVALSHDAIAFDHVYRSLSQAPPGVKVPHEYDDLLMILPDAPWRTSLLIVLLLLKMRLLGRLRKLKKRFEVFTGTSGGACLDQAQSVVYAFLIGHTASLYNQEKQIQTIFERVHRPLICTICNARPLTRLDAPSLFHFMVPPECWQILQDCFMKELDTADVMQEFLLANQEAMTIDELD